MERRNEPGGEARYNKGAQHILYDLISYIRAGGKGTAGTAMAVPVFEGEKMASLGF